MGHLGKENQNAESVNKPGHHRLRDKTHQPRHTQRAEQDLNHAGHHHRGQNVLHAVLMNHRADNQRDGTCRRRYHRRTTAEQGKGKTEHHRGDKTHFWIYARDHGERNDFRDQRQRGNHARQRFAYKTLRRT